MQQVGAVLLDAGFTLVAPKRSVPEMYYQVAFDLKIDVDKEAIRRRLAELWPKVNHRPRAADADLSSSEIIERQYWWNFTRAVAESFPSLLERHEAWYRELVAWFDSPDAWVALPGAQELLADLRRRSVPVAIVSNWHSALPGILAGLGMDGKVDLVLTSADAGVRKPSPRIFEKALQDLSVDPRQAVHVGDSLAEDVAGAAAVGIRAIWITTPESADFSLDTPHAGVERIDHLSKLLPLLALE